MLTMRLQHTPSTTIGNQRPQLYIQIEILLKRAYSAEDSALAGNTSNQARDASTLDSCERACLHKAARYTLLQRKLFMRLKAHPNHSTLVVAVAQRFQSIRFRQIHVAAQLQVRAARGSKFGYQKMPQISDHVCKKTLNCVTLLGTKNGVSFGNVFWSRLLPMIAFAI